MGRTHICTLGLIKRMPAQHAFSGRRRHLVAPEHEIKKGPPWKPQQICDDLAFWIKTRVKIRNETIIRSGWSSIIPVQSRFLKYEAKKKRVSLLSPIPPLPGWDGCSTADNPLSPPPPLIQSFPYSSPLQIYNPRWRGKLYDQSVLSKNTTEPG